MKLFNLTFGDYKTYSLKSISIPDDVSFFFEKGEIGNVRNVDCEHYTTVVETTKYKDWLADISKCVNVYVDSFCEYSIVTIKNMKIVPEENSYTFPIVEREEWFKKNNIDFSKYIIVLYNKNKEPWILTRIKEFKNIYNCTVIRLCLKSPIDYEKIKEHYEMLCTKHAALDSIMLYNDFEFREIIKGEKAEMLWNDSAVKILNYYNLDNDVLIKNLK